MRPSNPGISYMIQVWARDSTFRVTRYGLWVAGYGQKGHWAKGIAHRVRHHSVEGRRIKRVAGMNYPCNLISGIRNLYSVICHLSSDLWPLATVFRTLSSAFWPLSSDRINNMTWPTDQYKTLHIINCNHLIPPGSLQAILSAAFDKFWKYLIYQEVKWGNRFPEDYF